MVTVITKRTVVADDYTELIIRYSSSKRYYIEARPDTKKKIPSSKEMELLDSMLDLDDETILIDLINHFFEKITLNRLILNENVEGQIGEFDTFQSIYQNKKLALQIAKSPLSSKIKERLRKKFYGDRSDFLEKNNDVNFYIVNISNEEASYYRTTDNKIHMKLYMKNANKYETEMEFLRNFLRKKLEDKDSLVIVYDDIIKYNKYNAVICINQYIQCGDFLIRVSSEFLSYLSDIIEEHNKKINKPKIKKLKMED